MTTFRTILQRVLWEGLAQALQDMSCWMLLTNKQKNTHNWEAAANIKKESQWTDKGEMTEEILNLMEEWRLLKNLDKVQYLEQLRNIKIYRKLAWQRIQKNSNEIDDKVKILSRSPKWLYLFRGCYHAQSCMIFAVDWSITIRIDIEGPKISKDKIWNAIKKAKVDPDYISVEMLKKV